MTRISRISTPRATLFAIALITVVMLTFGAFSAEEAAGTSAPGGVSVLAGEPASNAGECQPHMAPPCPLAQGEPHAVTGNTTER